MNLKNDVSIIILASNEEQSLINTIKTVFDENSYFINKIIIITPHFVSSGCLETINKLKNLYQKKLIHKSQPSNFPGYGGASIFGISIVDTNFFSLLDADGETDPKEVKNMIKYMANSDFDIISCSRWLTRNWIFEYGIVNYILNFFFQKITSILFLTNLTDHTVGYRMYKTNLMKNIKFKYYGQNFSLESILIPLRKNFKIKEIPYNFKMRQEGYSRNNFLNRLKYIATLLECRFRDID